MAESKKDKTKKNIKSNGKNPKIEKDTKKTKKTKDKKEIKVNNTKTEKSSKEMIKSKKVENKEKLTKETVETFKEKDRDFSRNSELAKLIKIVLIVTAIMLVFYLITLVATNKADETNETLSSDEKQEVTQIQYDYIMIGTMLDKEGSFYVLIEEDEDNRISEYSTLIETAKANEDNPAIYKSNLTDAFNKNYLSKEAKYDVTEVADFRVTGTTLVKIVDNEISEIYDSYEKIKEKLTELSK